MIGGNTTTGVYLFTIGEDDYKIEAPNCFKARATAKLLALELGKKISAMTVIYKARKRG